MSDIERALKGTHCWVTDECGNNAVEAIQQLIRTEKLKLLAAVRERAQEMYTPVFRVDAALISEINKLEAEL